MNEQSFWAECAPYCAEVSGGSGRGQIQVALPDGCGGIIEGYLTPEQARNLTLGLRSVAAAIDGKPFFTGGWSKSNALREIADDYERVVEGGESQL